MHTTHRTLAATLALLATAALLAQPASAQEGGEEPGEDDRAEKMERHGHERAAMRGMHRMRGGHGAMLAHLPVAILHQREMLELSDQQVSRLEALRDSVRAIRDRGRTAMREAHEGGEGALGAGGIDIDAYRQSLRAAADRKVEHRVAVATAARDALQVLDEGQREKFLYGVRLMHRMRAHHGPGHDDSGHRGDRERRKEHDEGGI